MNPPPTYPHAEHELAQALGLAHDALKNSRRELLRRGTDWEMVKGQVCYTEGAKHKVLAALKIEPLSNSAPNKIPPAAATSPAEKIATPGGRTATLVCKEPCRPNTRLVLATFGTPLAPAGAPGFVPGSAPQTGAKVQRVRVRDNRNFTAGMTMLCRHVQDNQWDLVQRLPRWKGKW